MIVAPWLLVIFESEYIALLLGFAVFTISYAILTHGDWRRTTAGRILMSLGASCSTLLALSIARLFLPEQPWRVYASAIALAGLVGVVVWLNALLFSRQLGRRNGRGKDQDERERQKL